MSRWQALPEELDPQISEFVGQLRRLVDHTGLDVNAVADRTGYSTTSWERYLDGRLLAPRGAVAALAEVTGAPQHHLTAMWEPAERAWRRAEMRHDVAMRAAGATQARAPHGGLGTTTAPEAPGAFAPGPAAPGPEAAGPEAAGPEASGSVASAPAPAPGEPDDTRPLTVPHQRGSAPGAHRPPEGGPRAEQAARGGAAGAAQAAGAAPGGPRGSVPPRRRNGARLAVGAVGALIVVVSAVLLAPGGDEAAKAAPPASEAPVAPELPVGVECSGADCAGQDPEEMGCGGEFARTAASAVVGGSKVEVRYSEVCSAAWARLTEAAAGDAVRITGGADGQDGEVVGATDTYTPMVAVKKVSEAKACATLASGTQGCTDPGR
ncbi:DUF2690 domain-containing protein [Streptomyces sp. NPDC006270]|uniref:helix-turn-helix domain-containing protein n=1 Tax=Streptomyces sp. NPDC006270 TaxID=3364741 RepID=UPI00367AC960